MSPIHAPQDDNLQRVLFVLGFACVFGIASFVWWIHNDFTLAMAKNAVKSQFISFQSYNGSLELPPLKIRNLAGKDVSLENFRGEFVLLNLWATWCAPCVTELPTLQKLKNHYRRENLIVMAVSIDDIEHPVDLSPFLKRNGVQDVAYYHDSYDNIQKAIAFRGLPTSFLISPDGRIIYEMTGGADWYTPEMLKFLDAVRKIY